MCAGTDNECVCIPYELRSEIFPRYTSHLIGYSLNRFFYKWYFTALILLGMLATGLLKFQIALAIGLACWAFFTFSALPTQFREWKAAEIAKSGLKEAGLWPLLPSDAMAVEQCLKALSWCNVAGFRRILPR